MAYQNIIVETRGPVGLMKACAAQAALASFLRDKRVSIVHTNEGPMHLSWSLPAKLAGAKLVWHHRSNPDARALRYIAPWLADQVVSVSRYALSLARSVRDGPNTSVIYSPFDADKLSVDREAARRDLVAELGVAEPVPVVVDPDEPGEHVGAGVEVGSAAPVSHQGADLAVEGAHVLDGAAPHPHAPQRREDPAEEDRRADLDDRADERPQAGQPGLVGDPEDHLHDHLEGDRLHGREIGARRIARIMAVLDP